MLRSHRRVHARIWTVLVIALPLALITALALRPNGPIERKAVQIEAQVVDANAPAAEAAP